MEHKDFLVCPALGVPDEGAAGAALEAPWTRHPAHGVLRFVKSLVGWLMANPRVFALSQRVLSRNHACLRQILSSVLAHPDGDRVLDLGCGVGHLARLLQCRLYVGVDFSRQYVRYARAAWGARFSVMDITRLGLQPRRFDWVLAIGVFHHLDDAAAVRALQEALHVMKPSGGMLIVDPLREPERPGRLRAFLSQLESGEWCRTVQEAVVLFSRACVVDKAFCIPLWPWSQLVMVLRPCPEGETARPRGEARCAERIPA